MVIWLKSEFLKYYIETELYLQNSPMNMKKFIDFCKNRGIKIDDKKLEELEGKNFFNFIISAEDNKDIRIELAVLLFYIQS